MGRLGVSTEVETVNGCGKALLQTVGLKSTVVNEQEGA